MPSSSLPDVTDEVIKHLQFRCLYGLQIHTSKCYTPHIRVGRTCSRNILENYIATEKQLMASLEDYRKCLERNTCFACLEALCVVQNIMGDIQWCLPACATGNLILQWDLFSLSFLLKPLSGSKVCSGKSPYPPKLILGVLEGLQGR